MRHGDRSRDTVSRHLRACAARDITPTICRKVFHARLPVVIPGGLRGCFRPPTLPADEGTKFAPLYIGTMDIGWRSVMKREMIDSKRTDLKPAATTPLSFDGNPASSAPNSPCRRELPNQPINAPTWARYIDSRMKHFGTR